MACVGFLVGGTGACVLIGGAGSCPLMGRAVSGGVFWGVCELSTTLGSLFADGWVCVPVLLVVWHEASSSGACRKLHGAGSWSRDGDFWESSPQLIFPGAGNFW